MQTTSTTLAKPEQAFPPHLFDATIDLADLLGLSLGQTVEALGSGWEPCLPAQASEGSAWFAAGDPVQVMVGVDAEQVLVACPAEPTGASTSHPTGQLTLEVLGRRPWWDPGLVAWLCRTVAEAQRRRRRSFRYCRYCRMLTPPEQRHSQYVCQGCAARYLS